MEITQVRLGVTVPCDKLLLFVEVVGGLVDARRAIRIVVQRLNWGAGSVCHDVRAVEVVWKEVAGA